MHETLLLITLILPITIMTWVEAVYLLNLKPFHMYFGQMLKAAWVMCALQSCTSPTHARTQVAVLSLIVSVVNVATVLTICDRRLSPML